MSKFQNYLEKLDITSTITKEDIENASNEQLLKYLDLTEKIKARLEVLEIKGGEE